ncbi:MAG: glycosyltransferase family 9 protein [Deltaproteobacteria bacterium]|nr:MAG: glycosyltransferase family 9 protein [Deltaproteobacteria bacterium]
MKIEAQNICLVRVSSIGDVVNTIPFFSRLRKGYPDAHISWVIEPKSYPVLENNPEIDEIIVFPRNNWVKGLRSFIRQLHKRKYDLALDLHRILKSGLITLGTGAKYRVGFDFKRSREFNWLFTNLKIPPGDSQMHVVEQYHEYADFLELPPWYGKWRFYFTEEEKSMAKKNYDQLSGQAVMVNIGASEDAKLWFPDRFAHLIEALEGDLKLSVILVGGKSKRELEMGREIKENCGLEYLDRVGSFNLRELMAVMSGCKLMISSDTGPMHLSSAMGVPTIGLFGAQSPRKTAPYNYQDYVIYKNLSCSPCFKKSCWWRKRRCMREITVDDVLTQVERVMSKRI